MWAGAEPERGVYNCTYFCKIHEIIQDLDSRGIYTLIDVHQDVLARQMCQEGVPDWFMKKDWIKNESHRFPFPQLPTPFTTDENGIPDPWSQCWEIGAEWFMSYFTVASADAFEKLYTNYDGLLDSFSDYWGKIAEEFGNYSSVMGYDLLNEPWAGNHWLDPTLLVPGVADQKHLNNVWQNCSEKIRAFDEDHIIFFEGLTWDILDNHPAVPGHDGTKAALSWHWYQPPQIFGLDATFINRRKDQERLGMGAMLTEFRMWAPGGDEDEEGIYGLMTRTLDAADKHLQSWMGWGQSSFVSRDPGVSRRYARTFATAVAGIVNEMGFKESTGYFHISWMVNKSIEAPTEIRINRRIYYPEGLILTITPNNAATWEMVDGQNIFVKYTDEAKDGEMISVEIMRGNDTVTTPFSTTLSSTTQDDQSSTTPWSSTQADPSSTTPSSSVSLSFISHMKLLLSIFLICLMMSSA